MIPIRNEAGMVVGFGARTLDGSQPKYLNSPQTAVFDKSGLLYGLDRAREAIREQDQVIIVEGYLDVLTAHQHGITNVVAPMGTSLTPKQMGIIKRLTENITLALDADAAGEQATLRGQEIAREAFSDSVKNQKERGRGYLDGPSKLLGNLKIIVMPQGKDPDEVIRESPDDWKKLVIDAAPVIDYFFNAVTSKLDLNHESGKSEAVEQLLPFIAELSDGVQQELYLKRLSDTVGVSERTLAGKIASKKRTVREKPKGMVTLPASPAAGHPLEEGCLAMLLQFPDLREQGLALSPEHFEGTENREIFIAWSNSADMESLRHSIDTSLHEHLDSLATKELPPASERERETALADYTRRLWEERLRRLKVLEAVLISEAEGEGDKEAINAIQEQVETLLQKALEPTIQLKEVFEKAKHERKGVRK
jgi:DNA primase